MKKIETVWCQLLYQVLEERETRFQIQKLSQKLSISTSTAHHALKDLRRMGAIRVGGNGGQILDTEKILMHWANHRNLSKDIVKILNLKAPVKEIEGLLPAESILGAYSAVSFWFKEAPADYSTVHVYHLEPEQVIKRFQNQQKGNTQLIILKLPPKIPLRKETTSLAHAFVDLWNLTDWMAKDFISRLREEIDGLLS